MQAFYIIFRCCLFCFFPLFLFFMYFCSLSVSATLCSMLITDNDDTKQKNMFAHPKNLHVKVLKANAFPCHGCAMETRIVRTAQTRLHAVSVLFLFSRFQLLLLLLTKKSFSSLDAMRCDAMLFHFQFKEFSLNSSETYRIVLRVHMYMLEIEFIL